jgi:PCFT/HCP family folate transporter-like MFS transporter 1/3
VAVTTNVRTSYPVFISGTLLGIHVMGKLLGMRDTAMIMVGSTAHALARVVFALAQVPWLFYVGKS